jgi:hypothetical protein
MGLARDGAGRRDIQLPCCCAHLLGWTKRGRGVVGVEGSGGRTGSFFFGFCWENSISLRTSLGRVDGTQAQSGSDGVVEGRTLCRLAADLAFNSSKFIPCTSKFVVSESQLTSLSGPCEG